MSVERPSGKENAPSWRIERTELSHGFLARFIGDNVTDYEQVNDLRHRVCTVLEEAGVDEETCDNAGLIVSELAANPIEHGTEHRLSELDLSVIYPTEETSAEVYISVISPTSEDTTLNSNPSMTDEQNGVAESGRGGIITEALTDGDWGWRVTPLRPEQDTSDPEHSLVVYAHLGAVGLRGNHDQAA